MNCLWQLQWIIETLSLSLSLALSLSFFLSLPQQAWNESEFEPAGSSPLSSVLLSPAPLSSRQDCQLQSCSLQTTWALEGHRTAFRPQQQGSSLPVGTLWGLGVQGQPGLSWGSGFMQQGDIEGCLRVLLKSGFSHKLLACPIKSPLRSISLSQFAFLFIPLSLFRWSGYRILLGMTVRSSMPWAHSIVDYEKY